MGNPADANYIYAEAQGGDIGRINRNTHEVRRVMPYPGYGEKKLRFNWNTPIQVSPNEKGTIYIGAQFLFRSRNHGQSWDRISPDLTTNNPEKQKQEESGGITVDNSAAEMHTSVYTISESPKNGKLIWVGTDDGNVQLTKDGGTSWDNVAANVKGVGENPWVTWVEASRFDEGSAYATFDRHTYGDTKPYVYKTTDYGATWTPLGVQDSGVQGYAWVIKEDTVDPKLLFLEPSSGYTSVTMAVPIGRTTREVTSRIRSARHRRAPSDERPRAGDARSRHLDHRRYFFAPRTDAGTHAGGGWLPADPTRGADSQLAGRMAGGSELLHRPEPLGRCSDSVLSALHDTSLGT